MSNYNISCPYRLVSRLGSIAIKPGVTRRTHLITARRICRVLVGQCQAIRAERRIFRREAAKLRPYLPAMENARLNLLDKAEAYRSADMEKALGVLLLFGRDLLSDCDAMDAALGFDRLCDLLEVNPVDRGALRGSDNLNVTHLVYVWELESSAARRGRGWRSKPCSPLFEACHLAALHYEREQRNSTPAVLDVMPDWKTSGVPN